MKLLKALEKDKNLQEAAQVFRKFNATAEEIGGSGEKIISAIYSKNEIKSLNALRYEMFEKSLSKNTFNLASLPPIPKQLLASVL